jgi:hypothetical protein
VEKVCLVGLGKNGFGLVVWPQVVEVAHDLNSEQVWSALVPLVWLRYQWFLQ